MFVVTTDVPEAPRTFTITLAIGEMIQGTPAEDGRLPLPGGTEVSTRPEHRIGQTVRVVPLGKPLEPRHFEQCPICGARAQLQREHVPPKSVGGTVLTWTCEDCNQGFHRLEEAMALRYRGQAWKVGFRSEAIEGRRRAGDVRVIAQADGRFLITLDESRIDPAIPEMLREAGEVDVDITEIPDSWFRTAILKHAYLCACVLLGGIPESSRSLREELVIARSALVDRGLALGPHARSVRTCLASVSAAGSSHPVAFAQAEIEGEIVPGFALGSFGFVSWPLADVPPNSPAWAPSMS